MSHAESQSAPKAAQGSRYKATLNLPKTPFPMKANLVQNEPASQARWEKAGLYEAVQQARAAAAGGRFVFHDGPPYANGAIHLGHLLNKTLKDLVVRTRLMAGLWCPYIPGWDCHGLPIEHKVVQEMAESGALAKLAALDDATRRMAIRRECRKYAEKYVKLQAAGMKRLLTLADYEHPYLTMSAEYEGATLELLATLVEAGLVYRRLKSVHWSIANQTALAEAELEYYDREDLSVYVDFVAEDADAVYNAFGLPPAGGAEDEDEDADEHSAAGRPGQRPCFMIWTTTPWTLPANLAIAVLQAAEYALVRVDGSVTVIAKDLVERVTKAAKSESVEVLGVTQGARLVGLRYRHPLYTNGEGRPERPDFSKQPEAATSHASLDGLYRVIAADYVTLEDGTGLVHTAPGHGDDDYRSGLRERLPIYCPVREDGTYDESVPQWLRGMSVWDANARVTDSLRESGHLFHWHKFTHSYPHDWRGKSPVIFRATEQWFIGVDLAPTGRGPANRPLRQMALGSTEGGVAFVPEWGRNRMRGMLESRPDWCISRQRSWGLPIPAFFGPDGSVLLTAASIRAVAKVVREKGSDAWYTMSPAELLRHYDAKSDPEAGSPRGVDAATLKKGNDILDVWLESGSSWHSVIRERASQRPGAGRDADFPTDLYLEGSDQHRGWFQSSLLLSLGATGQPPFKTVLTHGFIVDKDGLKMSKSLGNVLDVENLVKEFGADVCRWWVASLAYDADIKADIEFFKTAGESYRKVRNTLRYLLSNLHDFPADRTGRPPRVSPTSLDAWALSTLDALSRDVQRAYEQYDFREATTRLYNFCNDEMSAVYLAAIKDRLYCDPADGERRRQTQGVLHAICDAICRLLAPILPHTADEAWRLLTGAPNDAEASVHLQTFAPQSAASADPAWKHVMASRDAGLRALEHIRQTTDLDNPLDACVVLPDAEKELGRFDPTDLADLLGVSQVRLNPLAGVGDAKVIDLRDQPRCERSWKRDGTVKQRSDGGKLCDRCAQAVGVA